MTKLSRPHSTETCMGFCRLCAHRVRGGCRFLFLDPVIILCVVIVGKLFHLLRWAVYQTSSPGCSLCFMPSISSQDAVSIPCFGGIVIFLEFALKNLKNCHQQWWCPAVVLRGIEHFRVFDITIDLQTLDTSSFRFSFLNLIVKQMRLSCFSSDRNWGQSSRSSDWRSIKEQWRPSVGCTSTVLSGLSTHGVGRYRDPEHINHVTASTFLILLFIHVHTCIQDLVQWAHVLNRKTHFNTELHNNTTHTSKVAFRLESQICWKVKRISMFTTSIQICAGRTVQAELQH